MIRKIEVFIFLINQINSLANQFLPLRKMGDFGQLISSKTITSKKGSYRSYQKLVTREDGPSRHTENRPRR